MQQVIPLVKVQIVYRKDKQCLLWSFSMSPIVQLIMCPLQSSRKLVVVIANVYLSFLVKAKGGLISESFSLWLKS